MKLSLIRFGGGGDAEVPAHIREKMATNWYIRHFNSYTTRGRANSVMAVLGGWILFGYTMAKWSKSRSAKKLASQPHPASTPTAHPSSSSAKKSTHH
ncbi:unnamed protein product [Rotaria sordida]|uniref:Uncharacterized protein n=1 Tax=Rotaria sordida TaxID=392033 RepID=A0A814AV25_9BILA|nr:unnamed protein product [Rotaria sordida]CAF0925149.1 unnamed protein product [Rotaria sordida]CAF0962705.1 unnamed protein product [Rotaria sordida]CAF1002791.1 unnamed protein product [Rotaria sordida]CAF1090378.1 unnamed protein product [Rotaria sordida]